MDSRPLYSIGLVADIQGAKKPTEENRFYSESNMKLEQCIKDWNKHQHLLFCVQLGDVIDGNVDDHSTKEDMENVIECLSHLKHPLFHVLGNHCLSYPGGIDEIHKILMSPSNNHQTYYIAKHITQYGHTYIVLDGTEFSVYGTKPGTDRNKKAHLWLEDHPLDQYPHANPWNGGFLATQLQWLKEQLEFAKVNHHLVFLLCHYPILESASSRSHLLWNYDQVLDIMNEYHGVVGAWISGHYHPGGFFLDPQTGIAHITLEAILESTTNAYYYMNVFSDHIELKGVGSCRSVGWNLPSPAL